MPDQDGARIDARAFLSGQERLEIQGRPVLLSHSFACAVCRSVCAQRFAPPRTTKRSLLAWSCHASCRQRPATHPSCCLVFVLGSLLAEASRFQWSAVSTHGGNGAAWAWDAQPAATWSPSQRSLPLLQVSGLWLPCFGRLGFDGLRTYRRVGQQWSAPWEL